MELTLETLARRLVPAREVAGCVERGAADGVAEPFVLLERGLSRGPVGAHGERARELPGLEVLESARVRVG